MPVTANKSLPLLMALALSACAVGSDYHRPAPPAVSRYTNSDMTSTLTSGDATTQNLKIGETVSNQWWTLFHSPQMNAVMTEALANNQTLTAAKATLAKAQAALRQAQGAYFPQIDANGRFQRDRAGNSQPPSNLYSVGATASYAPDVFGGTRRSVERQRALAENQRYQLAAAYLTLTGNVVSQCIELASLKAQLAAISDIVAQDEKNRDLVQQKLNAGKAARLDLLTAESQLANDRTQLAPLRQRVSVARHALTVLVGKFPGEWTPPDFDITKLTLPADLPVSLPSELVHQRPDILAAEAQLHADSAAVGIATADMFPQITLSATGAYQSNSTNQIFTPANLFWNLAAGITAPIFHGGALKAQQTQAREAFKASAALYQQTVLEAFGQVADTLRALQHDGELLGAQKLALDTAEAALKLQRISYDAGKSDLLKLLDAERSYQQARLGYVRADSQRYQDSAQLFLAMGGGWWPQVEQ